MVVSIKRLGLLSLFSSTKQKYACILHAYVVHAHSEGMDTPGTQIAEHWHYYPAAMYGNACTPSSPKASAMRSMATYPVLSGIDRCGPATAKELAHTLSLDRSVVSRHASTLESAGLVVRAADPRDPRWTQLTLTQTGRDAVHEMRHRLVMLLDEFLSDWPATTCAEFARMLSALTQTGPFAS